MAVVLCLPSRSISAILRSAISLPLRIATKKSVSRHFTGDSLLSSSPPALQFNSDRFLLVVGRLPTPEAVGELASLSRKTEYCLGETFSARLLALESLIGFFRYGNVLGRQAMCVWVHIHR